MPILNYTTEVDVNKTVGEISRILLKGKARQISIDYDEQGFPLAILFTVHITGRMLAFRLTTRAEGVYRTLMQDANVPKKLRTREQAQRVAWRIKKDLLEAQMASVQAEEAELAELLLAWAVDPKTGVTVYEQFKSGYLLGSGDTVEGEYREE